MMRITITLIFMGLFLFLGLGQDSKKQNSDKAQEVVTYKKITQQQYDELYDYAVDAIKFIKTDYLSQGIFLPIGFSYSLKNEFKLILYDEPTENGKLLSDYVYEKIKKSTSKEFEKDSIRITCVLYNGSIKSNVYPNGQDCFSFLFESKDFSDYLLINFPVKIENGEVMYAETVVQILTK